METEDFDTAYGDLQEFLVENKDDRRLPTALFMIGICESSMGFEDECVVRMTALANDYPKEAVAPQALSWLGRFYLSRQEYQAAYDSFVELSQRYPESTYAAAAKEYMDALDSAMSRR